MKLFRVAFIISLLLLVTCSRQTSLSGDVAGYYLNGKGDSVIGPLPGVDIYVYSEDDVKAALVVAKADYQAAKIDADNSRNRCSDVNAEFDCLDKASEKENGLASVLFTALQPKIPLTHSRAQSDGRFTVTFSSRKPIYLAADASYSASNLGANRWLVRIEPQGGEQKININDGRLNRATLDTLFANGQ